MVSLVVTPSLRLTPFSGWQSVVPAKSKGDIGENGSISNCVAARSRRSLAKSVSHRGAIPSLVPVNIARTLNSGVGHTLSKHGGIPIVIYLRSLPPRVPGMMSKVLCSSGSLPGMEKSADRDTPRAHNMPGSCR